MASFFENGASSENLAEDQLAKALEVGYGTNPTEFTGGRALVPEDLESTLTNILSETDSDCKLFASLHKQPVKSTVHEIIRRTGYGDHRFNFVGEGDESVEDTQELERKIFETKYIQTLGQVTKQMELVDTVEGAYESEKLAAVNRVALTAEQAMFHGNSTVVPKEFDGLEKVIADNAGSGLKKSTLVDIHGLELGVTSTDTDLSVKDTGEAMLDDIAEKVFEKGGDIKRALYPPVLSKQFKRLYTERLRYLTNDKVVGLNELPDINTAIGSTIKIKGADAGADKLYRVKGTVNAAGNASKRPNAPSSVTVTANASASDSKFYSSDAGTYYYAVHAINAAGISAAKAAEAAVTVAAGGSVTITITPSSDGNAATGFIITRSAPGGETLMEMVSIANSGDSTTVYTDLNDDLPGTASMILLSNVESKGRNAISFAQLMPITSIPIPMTTNIAKRFVVALFGTLEVRNPEQQAMVKNIGYTGGLYHS